MLDPQQYSDDPSFQVLMATFEPLYEWDYLASPPKLTPLTAAGPVELSADGKTWTIRMKRGSGGAPVAARGGTTEGQDRAPPIRCSRPPSGSTSASPGNHDRPRSHLRDAGLARAGGRQARAAGTPTHAHHPHPGQQRPRGDLRPPPLPVGPVASTRDNLNRKALRRLGFPAIRYRADSSSLGVNWSFDCAVLLVARRILDSNPSCLHAKSAQALFAPARGLSV